MLHERDVPSVYVKKNYWTRPFIACLPMKMEIFLAMVVYKRVPKTSQNVIDDLEEFGPFHEYVTIIYHLLL